MADEAAPEPFTPDAITIGVQTGLKHVRITLIHKGPAGETRETADYGPGQTVVVEASKLASVQIDEVLAL